MADAIPFIFRIGNADDMSPESTGVIWSIPGANRDVRWSVVLTFVTEVSLPNSLIGPTDFLSDDLP
jgi:hypothetical protein